MNARQAAARPWIRALWDYATEKDCVDLVADQLELLEIFWSHPDARRTLGSHPRSARVVELASRALGSKVETFALSLLAQLARQRRLGLLPALRQGFETRRAEAQGVASLYLELGKPLAQADLSTLVSYLEKRFGQRLDPTVVMAPALLGGFRARVGDQVLDASVAARLGALEHALGS